MLDDLRKKLSAPLWINDVPALRGALADTGLSAKKIVKEARDRVLEESSKRHQGRVLNWFVAGMVVDQSRFIAEIKRSGALRASRYEFDPSLPRFVAETVLQHASELSLGPQATTYLRSAISLLCIAEEVRNVALELRKQIHQERDVAAKGMLATLDLMFMEDLFSIPLPGAATPSGYDKEELAEGFSYLFHLLIKRSGVDDWAIAIMDPKKVADGGYLDALQKAASIRRFLGWEILVDSLDYSCTYSPPEKKATLRAPVPEVEKALRMGFIAQALQQQAFAPSEDAREAAPLEAIAARLYGAMRNRLIELREEPAPRFVFKLPLLYGPLQEMLGGDPLFLEEGKIVEFTSREQLTDPATFLAFELRDGLTVLDLIKAQRVINVIRMVSAFHFEKHLERDLPLVVQSLLPSMPREQLEECFGLVVGEAKARQIIALLDWRESGEKVFDVQYQPLIRGENHFLLPVNVLGASDIVRNSMQLVQRRLGEDQAGERLTSVLARMLSDHAPLVTQNLEYEWSGEKGEIDVLMLLDSVLFAFECKHPLIPTGMHELRTTIDHMRKGGRQLDRFVSAATHPEFLGTLQEKTGWALSHPQRIVTCVVNGNRMFSGARLFGHPVRSLFELMGFLGGKIRLRNYTIGVRRQGALSGGSLIHYIENDSIHRLFFAAMDEVRMTTQIGSSSLDYESYALDIVGLLEQFGIRLPRERVEGELVEAVEKLNEARQAARARAMRGEAPEPPVSESGTAR